MTSYREQGVTVLVSLLEHQEAVELDLASEAEAAQEAGLEYRSFTIRDRGVPISRADAMSFVEALRQRLDQGAGVAIHCRAGIGRSALIAGAILLSRGLHLAKVLELLRKSRGMPVPETPEQMEWLKSFWR
jgi:protein-tyrosine phosphatase